MYSYSSDNFAKLFRPKTGMTNKILELTIDDLHYYSYPIPCINEENDASGGNSNSGSGGGTNHSNHSSSSIQYQNHSNIISLFNVIIVTVKRSALLNILQRRLLQLHSSVKSIQLTKFPIKQLHLSSSMSYMSNNSNNSNGLESMEYGIHSTGNSGNNRELSHSDNNNNGAGSGSGSGSSRTIKQSADGLDVFMHDHRMGGGGNSYLGGVLMEIEQELKKIDILLNENESAGMGGRGGPCLSPMNTHMYGFNYGKSGTNPINNIIGLNTQQYSNSFVHNSVDCIPGEEHGSGSGSTGIGSNMSNIPDVLRYTNAASVTATNNYIANHLKLLSVDQYCTVSEAMIRK